MKTHPPLKHRVPRLLCVALAASAAFLSTSSTSTAGIRGLYVGNDFYPPSTATEISAKASGFNRLFLFTGRVEANGDITYNDNLIVRNGVYVGNSTWASRLSSVENNGRITRIEFCLGGWGNTAFNNIRDLVASQGTGSGSILYKNFRALKNELGTTAIQFDDEMTYDTSSAVAFGKMLNGLGYKVTLCPYNWNTRTFWQSVKSQLGSGCDAIYLQCYDGGAGNNPADWNSVFGGFKVTPGLWGNTTTTKNCVTTFRDWNDAGACNGGFMWLNGNVQYDVNLWGDCLKVALEPLPYFMLVNKNSGKSIDLIGGDTTNGAEINQWSYDYNSENQRWALIPSEDGDHFKIVSCVSGRVLCVVGNSTADSAQIHAWEYKEDDGQRWDLVYDGDGWYRIKNVKSGKVLSVMSSSSADNADIVQYSDNATSNQLFRLHPVGDYFIRTLADKYVAVAGTTGANGASIIQDTKQNTSSFKWHFIPNGEGWERVSSYVNLDRAVGVDGGSQTEGADAVYWNYDSSSQSEKVRLLPLTNGEFKFVFKHSGMVWDVYGGSSADNTPIRQYPSNSYSRQQFNLDRIP